MLSVVAAIIALAIGVALVPVAQRRPAWLAGLDGFMLVAIGGVLAMDLLPYSFQAAGGWALVALALGAGLPVLLERGHHHDEHNHDSTGFLIVAAVGLAIHAFLDGGALASRQISDGDHSRALELGVLAHRLPMGVMIGMLAGTNRQRLAWSAAGIVAIGTIGGFWVGVETLPVVGIRGLSIFQALVAGTLVHVLYTHNPIRIPSGHRRANNLGLLAGILCLAAMQSLNH